MVTASAQSAPIAARLERIQPSCQPQSQFSKCTGEKKTSEAATAAGGNAAPVERAPQRRGQQHERAHGDHEVAVQLDAEVHCVSRPVTKSAKRGKAIRCSLCWPEELADAENSGVVGLEEGTRAHSS